MIEYIDSEILPEQRQGFGLNNLVELKFLEGSRGRIKKFKYNEQGERVADVQSSAGDYTARLDQIKKIE